MWEIITRLVFVGRPDARTISPCECRTARTTLSALTLFI